MDPHPHLMKTQINQELFRTVDHRQLFFGDCLTVNKSGGQAGKGLFVPCGQTEFL
jgi:hypothetical protein